MQRLLLSKILVSANCGDPTWQKITVFMQLLTDFDMIHDFVICYSQQKR